MYFQGCGNQSTESCSRQHEQYPQYYDVANMQYHNMAGYCVIFKNHYYDISGRYDQRGGIKDWMGLFGEEGLESTA